MLMDLTKKIKEMNKLIWNAMKEDYHTKLNIIQIKMEDFKNLDQ
jgi:hypothetical protein